VCPGAECKSEKRRSLLLPPPLFTREIACSGYDRRVSPVRHSSRWPFSSFAFRLSRRHRRHCCPSNLFRGIYAATPMLPTFVRECISRVEEGRGGYVGSDCLLIVPSDPMCDARFEVRFFLDG